MKTAPSTTPIKPAATVMCVRETPDDILEVLLLRRNTELKFASGYWVFPGGKIEESDGDGILDDNAARKAAVREAKEEANLDLNDNTLSYFCNWTTPVPSVKRFETWFFITKVGWDNSSIVIDDSEIKDYLWLSPSDAIDQLGKGSVKLMPPTFLALNRIKKCTNFDEAEAELLRSAPLIVKPKVGMIEGVFQSMYPGDAGYDAHNVLLPGPRHRLSGNIKNGTYSFEYHGCDDQFPVSGGHEW